MAKHGTRTQYNAGCRCLECVTAQREYRRDYRQRRNGGGPLPAKDAPAPALPVSVGVGPVEASVVAQLETLVSTAPWAGVWRVLAVNNARGIDRANAASQFAYASAMQARLRDCIDRLGGVAPRGTPRPPTDAEYEDFLKDL